MQGNHVTCAINKYKQERRKNNKQILVYVAQWLIHSLI